MNTISTVLREVGKAVPLEMRSVHYRITFTFILYCLGFQGLLLRIKKTFFGFQTVFFCYPLTFVCFASCQESNRTNRECSQGIQSYLCFPNVRGCDRCPSTLVSGDSHGFLLHILALSPT